MGCAQRPLSGAVGEKGGDCSSGGKVGSVEGYVVGMNVGVVVVVVVTVIAGEGVSPEIVMCCAVCLGQTSGFALWRGARKERVPRVAWLRWSLGRVSYAGWSIR